MEGFGSELSLTAIIMILAKVARDVYVEWQTKKRVVKVVNGGNPAPAKSGTSTNLVLHLLEEHGEQLHRLNEDMTAVKVDVAVVKTKLGVD